MTLPAWPTGLPTSPELDTWSMQQITNPGLRSDMNAGTTRQRRKYTMRIAIQKFVMLFIGSQIDAFTAFYEQTLGDGTARFTMPVWNGYEFVTRNCAFKTDAPPSYAPVGISGVKVTMTMLVENL